MNLAFVQALSAAGLWGGTDLLAGVSSRRSSPLLAAFWLHVASLVVLLPFLFIGTNELRTVSLHDLAFGAMAGVAAAVGDVLFGKALVKSAMSVGIPLANVIAAALPAALAFIQGEHVTLYATLGIAGALLSTLLASMPSKVDGSLAGAGYAIGAGLLFGFMYALLSLCHSADVVAVVFVMRVAGTAALLPGLFARRFGARTLINAGLLPGVLSGVASVGANLLFVVAVSKGDRVVLSVVAIALASPAAVLAALLALRERLTIQQSASTITALCSIGLLAIKAQP